MPTFDSALADFRSTFTAVQEEDKQRAEIMGSEDYAEFQRVIDGLLEDQKAMLAQVPDSREEHELDKKELIDLMIENNLTQAGEFVAKTRAKRTVDTYEVLKAVHGDIDTLMLLCSVKQKDLETFIKDNPDYKRDLRQCIRDEGFTISDLVLAA